MKIKYRRFDDDDYTEVEVSDFVFCPNYNRRKMLLGLSFKSRAVEKTIENVCEVYIEEI